jgi:ribosome-binding factor A
MSNFKRADRVADLIKMEMADIFLRRLRDPRVGAITITEVRVTDDLSCARVFFVPMGKEDCSPEVTAGLTQAKGFLRRELGKRLKLRSVPELVFTFDDHFVRGSRLEKLLAEISDQEPGDVGPHN